MKTPRRGKAKAYCKKRKGCGIMRSGNSKRRRTNDAGNLRGTVMQILFALLAVLFIVLRPKIAGSGGGFLPTDSGNGRAYEVVNGNVPNFDENELPEFGEIRLSELDRLGRCGPAEGVIGSENFPKKKRGDISAVHPSGWVQKTYEGLIDTDPPVLYNRCHLIAHMFSGLNADERNLITGTRFMNTEGMLEFEERVRYYVEWTGNHVAYRVSPDFRGNELVARGVHMEAMSVEDGGKGLSFNVYCPNVQPGIEIDYSTGESAAA